MQLYSGSLNSACFWKSRNGTLTQVEVRPCGSGSGAWHCMKAQVCLGANDLPPGHEPLLTISNGTASFDNAAIAFLTVASTVTQEGWTSIMYVWCSPVPVARECRLWIFCYSIVRRPLPSAWVSGYICSREWAVW